MGQPRIGTPQLERYVRMRAGQTADMNLVDNRVGVRALRGPVSLPVEKRIYTTERTVYGALSVMLGRSAEKPILYPNKASSYLTEPWTALA